MDNFPTLHSFQKHKCLSECNIIVLVALIKGYFSVIGRYSNLTKNINLQIFYFFFVVGNSTKKCQFRLIRFFYSLPFKVPWSKFGEFVTF